MFEAFIGEGTRPERTIPKEQKDKVYHLKYGRWCIFHANNNKHTEHLDNIKRNRDFYSPNKQWNEREDFDTFLMDTSGQTTNRMKVEVNYIQVMANQFIGNVIQMGVRSRVQAISPMAKYRYDEALAEHLMWHDAAYAMGGDVAETIMANKPIGKSEADSASIFGNMYTDDFVLACNGLLKYSEDVNNIEMLKKEVAESMAISGMGVVKPEVTSAEYVLRWVQPERFFFDRDARKYDLSDASYMGEFNDSMTSEIYERCMLLGDNEKRAIESYKAASSSQISQKANRLRTYKAYWRDVNIGKWGYVENEYGDLSFEAIDYTYENEDKPRYTEKDVVAVSKLSPYQKKIVRDGLNGKAWKTTFTDQWRFVEFVPREYLGGTPQDNNRPKEDGDLVLDYGTVPYQEPNLYSPFNMETPYKVGFYIYTDGYVYSPLDIAINPQRIANRLVSVVENMMNNAIGTGTVIAKEAIDKSNIDETQIQLKMKQNKPIVISAAAFGGIQNTVGEYGSHLGQKVSGYMETAQQFLVSIEKITGVNEAMKGQMERPDQLVGTMQLMIKKGTVVTERYYTAIQEIFRQCYQSVATSGKRFYINEKPKLTCLVDDKLVEILELTKDMALEKHRVKVEFVPDKTTERQYVDQMLVQLLQIGLIDKGRFSILMGRASIDEMWYALRESTAEIIEMEKASAEQQQMEGQMAAEQQQVAQNQQQEMELTRELIKHGGADNQDVAM